MFGCHFMNEILRSLFQQVAKSFDQGIKTDRFELQTCFLPTFCGQWRRQKDIAIKLRQSGKGESRILVTLVFKEAADQFGAGIELFLLQHLLFVHRQQHP